MRWRWILFVLLTVFLIGISTRFRMTQEQRILNQVQNDTSVLQNNNSISYAKVKEVVDGDTVKLESGETVRYLGMDAPEVYEYDDKTKKWDKTNNCYSQEAMNKNKELVEGKVVRLEEETSDKDKYGRLLRDVWVDSCHPEASAEGSQEILRFAQNDTCSKFINLELVKEGFAKRMTVPPDKKYEAQILGTEKEAREKNLGLWGKCE